jgi:ABC-type multidrug transport system ATPase subunit
MSTSPPAVDAAGLCRRYGRRWALVDVGLEVPTGRVAMVTGRNGSGKSTLLRILSTAIRADRGSARVAGFDLGREAAAVRLRVALLSHHSYHYEALTPLENLGVAARFVGLPSDREGLLGRLATVGLADRADDPVSTFSAGMRKRLSLARTLLRDSAVVMLDEPYGQLDPPGFRLVDRLIGSLRDRGATVLVATHLLERGAGLADLAVVLEAGRLLWSGPAAELPARAGADPDGEGAA